MASLFYGLNIARNSLITQTSILNVTAHNISNAETPGYSRQSVMVTAIADDSNRGLRMSPSLSIGSGSEAMEVSRMRFALYDEIFRNENQNLNDFIKTEELMNQVELLFDEPSDRGMSSVFNDFFNGWQEVGNDPQNMAARQSLKSFGTEMASRLHRVFNQLQLLRDDINTEIGMIPEEINQITTEIAELNVAIRVTESQRASANDLRDKRDLLVDNLSEFADVRALEQDDGTYSIVIGSQVVVEHEDHTDLKSVSELIDTEGTVRTAIVSSEGIEYVPTSGKLGALIRFRDDHINEIIDKLHNMTEAIVNAVNYEHRFGYGLDGSSNVNFFDPAKTKAFNIEVSAEIDDIKKIAVSGDGTYGDNSNAIRINDIKDNKIVNNEFSLSEYYNAMIAETGIIAAQARSGRENEQLLVAQIDNARESIKGVNIDSELIQMITSQRIYQSASRLVTVLDEMLQDVIRMKG